MTIKFKKLLYVFLDVKNIKFIIFFVLKFLKLLFLVIKLLHS